MTLPALTQGMQVPDYLRNDNIDYSHMSDGLAGRIKNIISVKGSTFTLKRKNGEDFMVPEFDQMLNNARYMDVVIVDTIPKVQRRFWSGGYNSEDGSPPSCFSADGDTPIGPPNHRQAQFCSGCPQNEVGSAVVNGKPTRACNFFKRIAVVPMSDPNSLYSFDVSSISLFGKEQSNFGVPYGVFIQWLVNETKSNNIDMKGIKVRMYLVPGAEVPTVRFTVRMGEHMIDQGMYSQIVNLCTKDAIDEALKLTDDQGNAHNPNQQQTVAPVEPSNQIRQQPTTAPETVTPAQPAAVPVQNVQDQVPVTPAQPAAATPQPTPAPATEQNAPVQPAPSAANQTVGSDLPGDLQDMLDGL